tara:strand:- start:108 stop:317 length:210 start_codon:yes stop_codon:yes gene_type:complete
MSDKYVIESMDVKTTLMNGCMVSTIVYKKLNYGAGDDVKIEVRSSKGLDMSDMNRELELKDIFDELQNK